MRPDARKAGEGGLTKQAVHHIHFCSQGVFRGSLNKIASGVDLFFVYSGSNFDLNFVVDYDIITLEIVGGLFYFSYFLLCLTTYLTIDSFGAHGNNGYKIAKEYFVWSGNGYKKPFVAERIFLILFGSMNGYEHISKPDFANTFSHYKFMVLLLRRKQLKTLYDHIFDHLHEYPAKSVLQIIFYSNQQPLETTASRGIFF